MINYFRMNRLIESNILEYTQVVPFMKIKKMFPCGLVVPAKGIQPQLIEFHIEISQMACVNVTFLGWCSFI